MKRALLPSFMLLSVVLLLSGGQVWAQAPNHVSFTLEGCRNDGTITLPNGSGQFLCPDADYTTGNLGKGWNELDLVPHRLTTSSGSQATVTTDYQVAIAGDGITGGKIGWDVIAGVTTGALEPYVTGDASCSAVWGPQSLLGTAQNPFGGGTDTVIFRVLTVHQNAGTSCQINWVQRLALGSHLYPGSSLQSYMATTTDLSGSKKTISIPVNDIQPQSVSKTMTATQGTDHQWTLSKDPTPATLTFPNTCDATLPDHLPVSISVVWTRGPADPSGNITVSTKVYATNPSSRVIATSVTDVIYSGTTALDSASAGPTDVPANTTNFLLLTHTFSVAAGTSNLNDIATATYTDTVTGVPVPGTTTATASADVTSGGPELNQSASITDTETLANTAFQFSVDSFTPLVGGFDGGYLAGTFTNGPVTWESGSQGGSGSITFDKTVQYTEATNASASIADSASLAGSDGATASASASITINANALVKLTINKHVTPALFTAQTFTFDVTDAQNNVTTVSVAMAIGDTDGHVDVPNLQPGTYTVSEHAAAGFTTADPQNVTISLPACSNSVTMNNTLVGSPLTMEKTATPSFDRTYQWSISKVVDHNHFDVPPSAAPNYSVHVVQTGIVESNAKVAGTITVHNPNPFAVAGVTIAEGLAGCTIVGTNPATVAANSDASVTYSCPLGAVADGTNTATATIADPSQYGISNGTANASAGYSFTGVTPAHTTNKTIHVTDTLGGALGTLTATDPPATPAEATFTYSHTFAGPASGCQSYPNTATITETSQTANASVEVCAAHIIVIKYVKGGTATFTFPITGGPTSLTPTLTPPAGGNASTGALAALPGTYTISENGVANWTLTDVSCTAGTPGALNGIGIPTNWTFALASGATVTCTYVNETTLTTRTQGFWATHTALANSVWSTVSATDASLCSTPITAIPGAGTNQLMGGFWAGISQTTFTTTGKKRSNLDQARMQMLQQYVAAVLNHYKFGAGSDAMLATARAAYCANNPTAIQNQVGILGSFNSSGDSGIFTPGASATAKESRYEANIPFWNVTTH